MIQSAGQAGTLPPPIASIWMGRNWPVFYESAAVAFLFASLRFYKARILTDHGAAFRSRHFRKACRRLRIKHRLTPPYTPRTNGKAEHFIQSSLREWAYAHVYTHSCERAAELVTPLQLASPPSGHRPRPARLATGTQCESPVATPQMAGFVLRNDGALRRKPR
jgi:transposase InsO family protein